MRQRTRWLGPSILILITIVLALGGCATPQPAAGPGGVSTDLGGREVTIMVENAYPPFNTLDEETGEGVGWDYDVWRAICAKLNCTPVFVESAWPPFEKMAAGELDVAADGITVTLARSMIVDFSDPYVDLGQVILVREDETEITGQENLAAQEDKIVGSQLGTTNYEVAVSVVGADRIRAFETFDVAVLALIAGDVDAVIIDTLAAVGNMDANPGALKIVGDPVRTGELLAFVFPPLSDLVAPVNWAMAEMFADGTMDEICQAWFFQPCTPPAE